MGSCLSVRRSTCGLIRETKAEEHVLGKELLSTNSNPLISPDEQSDPTASTPPASAQGFTIQMDNKRTPNVYLHAFPRVVELRFLQACLKSKTPLILHRDTSTPDDYHPGIAPQILQVCKTYYHLGKPILYGKNIFSSSSPSTSHNFDEHLTKIAGKNCRLITRVTLQIDWADDLWKKFPLIANHLAQLSLQRLIIIIVKKKNAEPEKEPFVLKEINTNASTPVGHVEDKGTIKGEAASKKAGGSSAPKREGAIADVMLGAEKKMMRDLVEWLPALKEFRLEGFRDEEFAKGLEIRRVKNL